MDLLDRLLDHDQWATTELLTVCRGLPAADMDRDFEIGHRTLRETFIHLIFNIEFWTAIMSGQPAPTGESISRDQTLSEWHASAFAKFSGFARRIRDEERFDETFVDHFEQPMTFGGAILHVILHDEGHRTELVHILARLQPDRTLELDHGLWDFVRRGLFQPG